MLKIENLSKSYAKSEVKAVDGLSLELKPGEIFGFLGNEECKKRLGPIAADPKDGVFLSNLILKVTPKSFSSP